jgi:hypothetical protein
MLSVAIFALAYELPERRYKTYEEDLTARSTHFKRDSIRYIYLIFKMQDKLCIVGLFDQVPRYPPDVAGRVLHASLPI